MYLGITSKMFCTQNNIPKLIENSFSAQKAAKMLHKLFNCEYHNNAGRTGQFQI